MRLPVLRAQMFTVKELAGPGRLQLTARVARAAVDSEEVEVGMESGVDTNCKFVMPGGAELTCRVHRTW